MLWRRATPFTNGVPIGRAINNSGAYVTNLNQQLVGIGVMGELVVTGDGLARGYFDPALNTNRFIVGSTKVSPHIMIKVNNT
jgi:non-ribosomal peptide synthetase component F